MNEPFVEGTKAKTCLSTEQFNFKRKRDHDLTYEVPTIVKTEEIMKKEIEE